jgi:hypothetical protein
LSASVPLRRLPAEALHLGLDSLKLLAVLASPQIVQVLLPLRLPECAAPPADFVAQLYSASMKISKSLLISILPAALLGAVRDGVASLTWNPETFAYASALDEATGRYKGLVAATHPNVVLDGVSLIVKPDAAFRQFESDRELPPETIGSGGPGIQGDGKGITTAKPGTGGSEPNLDVPVRFYGRVTLGPVRLLKEMGDIAEAVIAQLSRAGDANVSITVEIEASAPKGFSDDIQRSVTKNARTLKFDTQEFEAE